MKEIKMNVPYIIGLIGTVLFLTVLPQQVRALSPSQVFEKVKDSIVVVNAFDTKGELKSLGSGVLLHSGKVATNCHVVEGGASYKVSRGKQIVRAVLHAEDRDKDICILDVKDIRGKPAQLGKAATLKVGDPVYAVGAPKGLELSLSNGIVSQLRGGPPPFIQTTAAISPGSSGGGLFDGEGRLVGITTASMKGGQNLNFAMPVEWIGEVKPGRKLASGTRSRAEWYKRTLVLAESKDWPGLLECGLNWVKSEPNNADAWFVLGIAYSGLKRYENVIESLHQCLSINPELAEAWRVLGDAYLVLKRYDDAINASSRAVRINPESANGWKNLGAAYLGLGRYDDAIGALRQAVRINPDAEAWYILGHAYLGLKRYDDAIGAIRQSLQMNSENAEIWLLLGAIYYSLNRYDDAIGALRQAVRINPEYVDAWQLLGNTYLVLRRFDDSVNAYRQVLRINPKNTEAWKGLGIAYDKSGNRTAALNVVQELRRFDMKAADELYNMLVRR